MAFDHFVWPLMANLDLALEIELDAGQSMNPSTRNQKIDIFDTADTRINRINDIGE